MKTIRVSIKANRYDIIVGKDILSRLGPAVKKLGIGTDAFIVTNPLVRRRHGAVLVKGLQRHGFVTHIIEVPDGEKSKSAQVAFQVISRIAAKDIFKKPFIVAFGGGVIGDLAGFVAAIYKRGIPVVQVPTTLLAQVDSAIGGKVAVDLPVGKNLVGAFHQPRLVWSDAAVLSTLNQRQIRNGLAEVVKYGAICDCKLFDTVVAKQTALLRGDSTAFVSVIATCSRIKADIVVADEKETQGLRTILNFGHTVGHAIEAADGFKHFQHGEAVALGMRVACNMSVRLSLLKEKEQSAVDQLLSDLGFPRKIRSLRLADILKSMRHDKKFVSGKKSFCAFGTDREGQDCRRGIDVNYRNGNS